jgi:RNA polymerase sigma-70 factor, ECF subfamily
MSASANLTSHEPDLQQLMRRYQGGDGAAATALVRIVSPLFVRFCLKHGDNPCDVDDVLQEIWLRIHQARHTYRPEAAAIPWLYAVARHTRLDALRRRQRFRLREVQLETVAEPVAETRSVGDQSFAELLAELPNSQREVVVMLKACGMTMEEVARATSSTAAAVKQKAYRAYEHLRMKLKYSAAR